MQWEFIFVEPFKADFIRHQHWLKAIFMGVWLSLIPGVLVLSVISTVDSICELPVLMWKWWACWAWPMKSPWKISLFPSKPTQILQTGCQGWGINMQGDRIHSFKNRSTLMWHDEMLWGTRFQTLDHLSSSRPFSLVQETPFLSLPSLLSTPQTKALF